MRKRDIQLDPEGHRLCRCGCGDRVGKGRRTFASEKCVHEWRLRTDAGYLREQTFNRDRGICAACGLDTEAARLRLRILTNHIWHFRGTALLTTNTDLVEEAIRMRKAGFPSPSMTWWHADHIVEVVRGGGECGLENIQTLCVPCHRKKTAQLAAERARERQEAIEGPSFTF